MRPSMVSSGRCRSETKGSAASRPRSALAKKAGSSWKASRATPARIVDVVVEHALDAAPLHRPDQRLAVETAGPDLELHEQPALGDLLVGALLPHVHAGPRATTYPPRVCISRCGSRLSSPIWMSGRRSRRGQPLLRPAVAARRPGGADQGPQVLARGARAQRLAQVGAPRGVEAEVPDAVGGEAAPVAGPAEGRGGGGDDPEHAAVGEPEAVGGRRALLHDRLDRPVARGEAGRASRARRHHALHASSGWRRPRPCTR